MPNYLKPDQLQAVREAYLATTCIRASAKATGVSRRTVRRYLALEDWNAQIEARYERAGMLRHSPVPVTPASYAQMDWSFIEKLFERMAATGENLHFKKHIRTLIEEAAREIGTEQSAVDTLRLETAFLEYLNYRKFSMQAITGNEGQYRSMAEYARTVERWRNMADRALTQVRHIIRELEIKHRKTVSVTRAGSIFVGPTQINLQPELGERAGQK
jgi:hypothetical protein